MIALSISKFEDGIINEDSAKATNDWIAISDGAGGGGVFADEWSRYLVEHIPSSPIEEWQDFDLWIDGIWEPFYNNCEIKAKNEGGMLLNKFYDEGAFATVVAVWKSGCWISYGDSVAFCYDTETGVLQHTFSKLSDFSNPPYLVNCKDPLNEKGFNAGRFKISQHSVVFVASDTLAHYILMMYEISHKEQFVYELEEAIDAQTKDSNFIRTAMNLKHIDFEKDVIRKLLNCTNTLNFKRHIQSLKRKRLIGHDDYSFAILKI